MHFLSFQWLSWMAATVALYWLIPRRWRDDSLALITLVFLLVHAPLSAGLLCLLTVGSYYLPGSGLPSGSRIAALVAVVVFILGFFKINASVVSTEAFFREAVIPLGLSYYSFRCLHYLLERYKGNLPNHGFRELVFYLFFLPTIVIGPINRLEPFLRDLRRKRWDAQMLSEGLERLLYGYVKIAVLGNFLVSNRLTIYITGLDPEHQALIQYLFVVQTGLNIYFQFSGFSDIAIGFARLLGYRIAENFHWPYFQKNISDFWRSWHISLSSWGRDYIYTTVFSLSRSAALGALATLLFIGLWHELSLRYVLWGLYHGLGIVIWQRFQRLKVILPTVEHPLARTLLDGLSILCTVHFVWFSFIIVRQPDLSSVLEIFTTVLFFWL